MDSTNTPATNSKAARVRAFSNNASLSNMGHEFTQDAVIKRAHALAFMRINQIVGAMDTALIASKANMPAIAAKYKAQAVDLVMETGDLVLTEFVFGRLAHIR